MLLVISLLFLPTEQSPVWANAGNFLPRDSLFQASKENSRANLPTDAAAIAAHCPHLIFKKTCL